MSSKPFSEKLNAISDELQRCVDLPAFRTIAKDVKEIVSAQAKVLKVLVANYRETSTVEQRLANIETSLKNVIEERMDFAEVRNSSSRQETL